MKETKVVDLLSLSLFQLDPRARSSQEALWRSLVETALYYAPRQPSQEELAKAIAYLLEQPEINLLSEINKAIEECIERDRVIKQDNSFCLTEAGFAHVKEMIERVKTDEEQFDEGLIRNIEAELGFSLSDTLVLRSTIKYTLQKMFREEGIRIQRLLDRESFTLEEIFQTDTKYDAVTAIMEKLKPVTTLFGEESKGRILKGVKKHFENLNENSQRYVARLYNNVFYHQILNLDPNLHAHQRSYFTITKLYLDTNTLITYLFDSDPRHKVTCEIIDASKQLGFQVVISPATLEETNGVIENARQLHTSLGDDIRITRLLTDTKLGRRSNPIIVTYLMKKKETQGLLWDNYIARYRKLEDLLLQKEILVEDESFDGIRTEENYSKVWDTIRTVRYEKYHDRIIYHDADNFVLIHKLRQTHESHPMGPTVWLLSWDTSLCNTERKLRKDYPLPHCYIVDDWGKVILPYQNISHFAFGDYIMYLVRSNLGITIDTDGLDLDIIAPLRRPEFDIDALLDLDDSNYVARTLASMQENKQIRDLAEQAKIAQAPEEISQLNKQLSTHLLDTVMRDKKSSEEDKEQLTRRLVELETKLYQIETRTYWQKLKALFGIK